MKAVILVVDDQLAMQRNMRTSLEMSGYKVLTACDGVEALAVLDVQPVDLVLADIAMPRLNGYQLYERLRENPKFKLLPFVFISARALDSDVRYGKSLGADDYLVKPFQLEDLLAVVAGRLRRAREVAQVMAQSAVPLTANTPSEPVRSAEPDLIVVGSIRLNPKQHRVWHDGKPVDLSPREFAILEYLARRPGEVVPLTELVYVTHGLNATVIEAGNLLYPLVRSLRRRLGNSAGDMGCIESVRGVGYRIVVPVTEV